MGWCLECHRAPEEHLRPVDEVTTMGYLEKRFGAEEGTEEYEEAYVRYVAQNKLLVEEEGIKPPQNCSACHY